MILLTFIHGLSPFSADGVIWERCDRLLSVLVSLFGLVEACWSKMIIKFSVERSEGA